MKIKKSYLAILIILLVLAAGYLLYRKNTESAIGWKVSKDGAISFRPVDIRKIKFTKEVYNENEYFKIEKIAYESEDAQVYGLLITPYSNELLPGIVLLPGAGVSKEAELNLSATIASLGFIVFTIDQRGTGETKAQVGNIESDFQLFREKKEPFQHLMVYDAILAAEILNSVPGIETNSIYIAGESLGGRNAMIAAAVDARIKGALSISSSGFGFTEKGDAEKDRFIKSLDADTYVKIISPRKFAMLHNMQDDKIPFDIAVVTFKKAGEPKNFFYVNETECRHGYCQGMHDALRQALYFLASAKV